MRAGSPAGLQTLLELWVSSEAAAAVGLQWCPASSVGSFVDDVCLEIDEVSIIAPNSLNVRLKDQSMRSSLAFRICEICFRV